MSHGASLTNGGQAAKSRSAAQKLSAAETIAISALTGFEATVDFVDDIKPSATSHNAVVAMAIA